MCESEKKEETPSEQPKTSEEKDGFLEALKKGGDEGLKEAFRYLSKDEPTARVEDGHLRRAVEARDPEISVQNAEEIIKQVNGGGLFSCDEFVKTIKMILALKKDMSEDGLRKAFDDIRQGESSIRVEDVRLAVVIRSPGLLVGNAKEIIEEANKGGFNSEEFVEIFKLLKEPGEDNPTEKTCKKLKEVGDKHEIILHGEKGVGKTWTAREVAARAVRRGDFDAAIWVYLNRSYDEQELSLQKSIAHQLSVLGDFEEFVAKEKKKKAEEEEAKKKEPEKNEIRDVGEDVAKKEADKRKEEIERLIRKALEGKRLLIVRDGDGDRETRSKAEITIEYKEKQPQKEKQKGGDEEKKDEGGEKSKQKGGDEEKKDEGGEKSNNELENKQEQGEGQVGEKKEKQVEEILFMELKRGDEVVKLELGSLKSYKLLTTTARKHQGGAAGEYEIIVKPFTWEASKSMAARALEREKVEEKLATRAVESEEVKKIIKELEELARYFMFRSQRLPSQLLLISRIVAYFGAEGESGLQKLRSKRDMIKKGQGTGLFDVLIQGYEERLPKSVLIDCYSPEKPDGHFMYRDRAVSFNELICYWIMEGYLGRSDHVDELYLKGHRVLMELMDCGLLQKQEADYVAPSGTTSFRFHIHDYEAFFIEPRPGIGITFDMSLGRVALGDGRIGTIGSKSDDGKDQIISTLLLDGNRISDEERTAETLSKYKDRVEVLAITNPTSQHFKLPILEMTQLRLLALRGCQFLGSLEDFCYKKPDRDSAQSVHEKTIERETDQTPQKPPPQTPISDKLEKLTVLEISGPCEVESIPDFFGLMPNLKTVNLSHLEKIQALPPSFYNLERIEFLILRGCSSLKQLGSLKKFKELKVLDVSDATSFEKFEDKSLHTNTKLQILNLSKTSLKTLPLINQLMELKFVWLRDCKVLPRIRKIDKMRGLKIFDIAGAGDVERFCDPSLEELNGIVIVDISGTHIRRIPANIGDPTYLYARDCPKLKVVPPVEGLTKLEVLDLSGCHRLKELRQEFFEKLKDVIRVLNLSNTRVTDIPFLSSLTSLQELVLSECKYLEKVEKLSCLEKMETLDLSGCEKVTELEEGSFDKMINLKVLNLSRTAIGALPSLSKLQSLEELYVRDCPNLNKLPGVEEARNLKVLDYSGTVLESPPSFKNQENDHLKVVGEGIESINTTDLLKHLGLQNFVEDERWTFKQEDVSHCKWIISNSRVENEEEKLGTPVYGAHFLRLLKEHPYILAEDKFCFLVYPSEAEAKIKARFPDKNSYGEEVGLREIYLGQVCEEEMKKCVEIREFNELPESLHPLLAEAQFVVLVDDTFLKTLLDLRVDSTMPMKACWIESCNELQYVVEEVKKPEGEAKSEEEEQKKNAAATVGGEGDKLKKTAEAKAGEEGKGEGDQQKKSAVEKAGETAKSEEGDQPKSEESEKGGGDQQAAGAEEKSEDPAKTNEGDHSETGAAIDNAGESGKGEGGGDEQKAGAVEKSEDPAKTNEGNQSDTGAAADNAGESGKGEGGGDEQKAGAEEKSEDPAKTNEVDQSETGTAADNAAESGKGESGGNEQKAGVEEKSEDPAKTNEGDQSETGAPADNAGESGKGEAGGGGDQQTSNAAEERTPEPAINEGGEKKEEKAGDQAKSGGDQTKNTAADDAKDSAKIEGDQEKKEGDQTKKDDGEEEAKIKGGEEKKEKKNAAEDLNKLQTLWISDASKMISICKGDINSVSFIFLKSLYLEFCPNLTAICASSSQLPILETLFIKYCQNLISLFEDPNPSKLENLKHLQLWGLDSLQKINCDTPSLLKLRVGECPLLDHLLSSRLKDQHVNFKENEGHEHLQTLHIKSCDKLKGIFEEQQPDVEFEKLEELELSGLPEMEKVAKAAPSLRTLRVEECPSLGSVISGKDGAPILEKLDVRSCERMKTVVGSGLSELKEIKLLGLPELEHVGPTLPGYVKLTVWACPKFKFRSF